MILGEKIMKRSNTRWAKFAAGAAVSLAMLAGAASPALAQEIIALTVNPTGTILPGGTLRRQLPGILCVTSQGRSVLILCT